LFIDSIDKDWIESARVRMDDAEGFSSHEFYR
jgi:hypothetical protein